MLAKAKRILAIPFNQSAFFQSSEAVDYPWLSDHELLHYGKNGRLFRYDLNTKVDQPPPALTHQIATSHAYARFLIVSPNGKSVLWGESGNNPFFAADVAGAHRFQWSGNGGLSESYWFADGHHWVEMQFSGPGSSLSPKVEFTRALLHDADAPSVSKLLPAIPKRLQGLDILGVIASDQIIARVPDVVKFGPPKKVSSPAADGSFVLTTTEMRTPSALQQISVWKLGQAAPLHRWTIHLPKLPSEAVVSPRGDQVAWLLSPEQSEMTPTALREASRAVGEPLGWPWDAPDRVGDEAHFAVQREASATDAFYWGKSGCRDAEAVIGSEHTSAMVALRSDCELPIRRSTLDYARDVTVASALWLSVGWAFC